MLRPGPILPGGVPLGITSQLSTLDNRIKTQEAQSQLLALENVQLKQTLQDLIDNKRNTTIKTGDLGWDSLEDATKFMIDKDMKYFGCIYCPNALCARIHQGSNSGTDNLSKLTTMQKLTLADKSEEQTPKGMMQPFPEIFIRNSCGIHEPGKCVFDQLKTRKLFDTLKARYGRRIILEQNTAKQLIRQKYKDPAIQTLLVTMLTSSCMAITKMFDWIAETSDRYEGLGIGENKAYFLAARLATTILQKIYDARSQHHMSFETCPFGVFTDVIRTERTPLALYTSLLVYDATKKFVENEFRDHPTITVELTTNF